MDKHLRDQLFRKDVKFVEDSINGYENVEVEDGYHTIVKGKYIVSGDTLFLDGHDLQVLDLWEKFYQRDMVETEKGYDAWVYIIK